MNLKLPNILIILLFTGLIVGTAFLQTKLRDDPQVYMLLFGLLTLVSLFAKRTFLTSIPFYILLGVMLYMNIFMQTYQISNMINPNDGWIVDSSGERQRVMQLNWVWCILAGLILSPLIVILYHKKAERNKVLEITFIGVFVLVSAIIYLIK